MYVFICVCVLHCHAIPHFQKGSLTEPDPGLWLAKCCDPLPLSLHNAWVPAMHMTMSIKLFVLALESRLGSSFLHSRLLHSSSLSISGTLLCIFLSIGDALYATSLHATRTTFKFNHGVMRDRLCNQGQLPSISRATLDIKLGVLVLSLTCRV